MSQKQVETESIDFVGVETRSRSRSKTPSRVTDVVKDVAKNPSVDTIMEEIDTPSSQTRSTSRKVKQTVVVQESFVSSEEVVSSTTTNTNVITSTARKSSKRQQSQASSPKKQQSKLSTPRKSKEIKQNEENMLLETSIESIQLNNTTNGSPMINNFAYKEYKEAGEYWNKYPKTDYTYSELSPYRREIVPGQICMPNMSRKSLELHHDRVVTMIQKAPPEQESFIRKRYQSTKSMGASLQYDSGDELDYQNFENRKSVMSSSLVYRETVIRRVWTMITTVITTIFVSPVRYVTRQFMSSDESFMYKTRTANDQGFVTRIFEYLSSALLNVLKRVYLIVSTILLWDTWMLMCRTTVKRNDRRRRFLVLLLFLLPLLLIGALYTSLTKEDASTYLNKIPASLPKFSTQPLVTYLSTAWTLPALPTLSLAWLSKFFKSSHRDPSHSTIKSALQGLDESSMNQILAHIDAYIDKIVTEKLSEHQDNVKSSQDHQENIINTLLNDNRLLVFIKNIVKNEKIVQIQPYELTEADIERIVEKVKSHLSAYLNELQTNMKNENEIEFEKKFGTLKSHMAQLRQNPSEVEPNMDVIIEKLLESSEFSNWLITYLSNWNKDALVVQETENKILRQEFDALKAALIKEMEELPGIRSKIDELKYNQDELKSEFSSSDAKIQANLDKILNELSSRLAKLENSQESYIDERIRKQLLLVFEHPDKNEGNTSLADLILWIKSIFITKDYLEARLNELNKNDDEKLKKEFDRLGASLLDEILIKVRNEMTSLNIEHSESEIDESSIVRVVKSILAVYDADKTGLPDYALETAGGQVISTRCTQFYQRRTAQISIFGIPLWYQSSTPRIAITPSVHPGQCWAFTGFPGYLVIQLSRSIHVTGFTVEHIPKTLAPNGTIDSAPKDFVVMGLTHEFDKEPAQFGTYEYQSEGEPLQYFPVQNKTIVVPYEFVEMRIDSNHGNTNYTCLYRIRVHGIPLP